MNFSSGTPGSRTPFCIRVNYKITIILTYRLLLRLSCLPVRDRRHERVPSCRSILTD